MRVEYWSGAMVRLILDKVDDLELAMRTHRHVEHHPGYAAWPEVVNAVGAPDGESITWRERGFVVR